jgi:hypothetical protein
MKITKRIGMLLLAGFLLLSGVSGLVELGIKGLPTILAILALAAGVFILLEK